MTVLIPRPEIRALTGLRGVAAAYVMLFHFSGGGRAALGGLGPLRSHGYLAVDVFFVLSGFVMALTYGSQFSDRFRADQYRTFLVKRIGRVYPAYLVATMACVALSVVDPAHEGPMTFQGLLANLFMVQAWGLSHSLDYPGWSVSTELVAYLMFPALATVALANRLTRSLLVAAVAAGVLGALAMLPDAELSEVGSRVGPLDIWSADTLYPVLRCLGGFVLGLCAWRCSLEPRVKRVLGRPWVGMTSGLLIVALLMLPGTDVAVVLVTAAFVAALAQGTSWPARVLAARPVHWLGTVSYSLYLVHYPMAWALGPAVRAGLGRMGVQWPDTLTMLVLVGLSAGGAALAYAGIERPGRALSRLVLGLWQPGARSVQVDFKLEPESPS